MSLVGNERAELSATFVNNLGVAAMVVGLLTPLAGYSAGAPGATARGVTLTGLVRLLAGLGLHLVARAILGGPRE